MPHSRIGSSLPSLTELAVLLWFGSYIAAACILSRKKGNLYGLLWLFWGSLLGPFALLAALLTRTDPRCSACRKRLQAGWTACPKCGTPLEAHALRSDPTGMDSARSGGIKRPIGEISCASCGQQFTGQLGPNGTCPLCGGVVGS